MRLIFFLLLTTAASCTSSSEQSNNAAPVNNLVTYAKGFRVEQFNHIYKLTLGKEEFWIVPKNTTMPDTLQNRAIIRTPISKMVVTSTSHVPMFELLEVTEALAGFPTLDLISSPLVRKRIDRGEVAELGRDNELNFEVLVQLQPELVMMYSLSGDQTQKERIKNAGIPVLINSDYLEQHPLGRAEWLKVGGLLFDEYNQADSIFKTIAARYNNLRNNVDTLTEKPSVLTGIMYGDTWYLPGGENYAANLFQDAGLKYLWNDNPETGFLQLSFEAVYEKASAADLWIGTASIDTRETLARADSRYTWFNPYKTGQVYTYTAKLGPTGGNEYLELGYQRPDIILADLIQIAYPHLLKERELYFYKKVE